MFRAKLTVLATLGVAVAGGLSAVNGQTVIYVDDDAPLGGTGADWEHAHKYFQDALHVAVSGDEIRVAGGTYQPDQDEAGIVTPGDREVSFELISGVALHGGYAGLANPGDPDQRDIALYETILSGDLNGDDLPDWTESDCCYTHDGAGCGDSACQSTVCAEVPGCCSESWPPTCGQLAEVLCGALCPRREDSYHVLRGENVDASATVEGFTVTAGNATGPMFEYDRGGGMYLEGCQLIFVNCAFVNNAAKAAAGVANSPSEVLDGKPKLVNCTLSGNRAGAGGGMGSFYGRAELIGCRFIGNVAESGAGMWAAFSDTGAPTLVNCVFAGNTAFADGGAVYYFEPRLKLTNSTLAWNSAGWRGGGIFASNSGTDHSVTNSILWGNTDQSGTTEEAQLFVIVNPPAINYTCVQNWSGIWGGTGNTGSRPVFVDGDGPDDVAGTDDDNLRLLTGSPGIDAGDNDSVPPDVADLDGDDDTDEPMPLDLDGKLRFVDDPTVDPDPGNPGALGPPVVDIGACEYQADCNANGVLDSLDLALGASEDCNQNSIPDECDVDPADPDGNGRVSYDNNANGVLDECESAAPTPEPGGAPCTTPGDCTGAYAGADCVAGVCYIPKNRYVSVDPTVNNDTVVAYQVEITEAPDYPTAVGRTWWVDQPVCYDYPNGAPVIPAPATCEGPDRFGWVSHLTGALVTRLWTEQPIHLTGCGLGPVVTYSIRAAIDEGVAFSDPLKIPTIHDPEGDAQSWGDITGGPVEGILGLWLAPERATNLADVQAAIRTFENRSEDTGFPPRVWVDVEINQVINLGDVQFIVSAFEGTAYADLADLEYIGVHPADCP